MIKFLLTSIAIIFLFRVLLRLLFGGFQIKVEKHYYQHPSGREKNHKPEEYTTLKHNPPEVKPTKYSDSEGEYVNYEEIK